MVGEVTAVVCLQMTNLFILLPKYQQKRASDICNIDHVILAPFYRKQSLRGSHLP